MKRGWPQWFHIKNNTYQEKSWQSPFNLEWEIHFYKWIQQSSFLEHLQFLFCNLQTQGRIKIRLYRKSLFQMFSFPNRCRHGGKLMNIWRFLLMSQTFFNQTSMQTNVIILLKDLIQFTQHREVFVPCNTKVKYTLIFKTTDTNCAKLNVILLFTCRGKHFKWNR